MLHTNQIVSEPFRKSRSLSCGFLFPSSNVWLSLFILIIIITLYFLQLKLKLNNDNSSSFN